MEAHLAVATPIQPPTFYFCSSKFYRTAEKSVDKYDIQNIYTAAKLIDNTQFKKEIVLLVNNRAQAESKIQSAMRQYLSEEAKYILGKDDLFAALRRLYEFLAPRRPPAGFTEGTLRAALQIERPALPFLSLRLHQHLAVDTIATAIQNYRKTAGGVSNRFLIGILPRGGKTYVAGGLVRALAARRVVVILGAKSETFSQFVGEMFQAYVDFADYTIVDVLDDASYKGALDPAKKYIFVMSIELFKRTDLASRPLLTALQTGSFKADLFICDEGHLKQVTAKSEKAVGAAAAAAAAGAEEEEGAGAGGEDQLDTVAKFFAGTPIVYMTGTYRKPLLAFQIPSSHTVIWDYEDLQRAKNLEAERPYFDAAFGPFFTRALETCIAQGQTMESIMDAYRRFPEIHLMTSHFSPGAKDTFLQQELAAKGVAGFPSLPQIFQINRAHDFTNPATWAAGFQTADFVQKLVAYMAPAPAGAPSTILDDIDEVAQRVGDRLRFVTRRFVPHSQLWFLPKMSGHKLWQRMLALAGVILQNPWLGANFDVLAVSGVNWTSVLPALAGRGTEVEIPGAVGRFSFACPSSRSPSLKSCIESAEARARAAGRGIIILAQNMLHLGISLKCVDIVALLDSGEDADERIQKMYRALTEAPNKKAGFVVDLNYFRTVSAITDYQIESFKARNRGKAPDEFQLKDILNKILKIYSINDNQPLFDTDAKQNLQIVELKKHLTAGAYKLATDLLDAGRAVNQNVEEHFTFDPALLEHLSEYHNTDKKRDKQILQEGEALVARAVVKREKESSSGEDEEPPSPTALDVARDTAAEARESILRRIKGGQEIFKILFRLGAFGSESSSLQEYIDLLRSSEEERNVLYDILITRKILDEPAPSPEKREQLFAMVIFPQLEKYLSRSEGDSYRTMRRAINSQEYPANTEKVLEYIKEHLSPKDTERQQFGEVFTPMEFVNDMLSHLPSKVWKDSSAKWLDPANGMGNFPIAVFLKLNESLQSEFPDEKARHKHIIQNMLYMFEINSKNSKIARLLFKKIVPDVEPNIWLVDSLTVTAEKLRAKGWPEHYTVVMGNPPFNRGGVSKGGGTLWPLFVKKAFEWVAPKGYIQFVHPTGWRKFYDPEDRENQGKIWYDVRQKKWALRYIKVSDEPPKHFPIVDTYVIQAKNPSKPTKYDSTFMGIINSGKAEINLPFIPNLINKDSLSILQKLFAASGTPIQIVYNQAFKPSKADEGKPGIPHYHFTDRAGEKHFYNKEYASAPAYINQPKVILTFGAGYEKGRLLAFYSDEQMGTTNNTMYMLVDSKAVGERLVAFFNSDPVTFLMKITQYSASPNHKNEFKILNQLKLPAALDWGFTAAEQELIQKVLEPPVGRRARAKTAKVKSKGGAMRRSERKTRRLRRV
jgi:hypothetical protein